MKMFDRAVMPATVVDSWEAAGTGAPRRRRAGTSRPQRTYVDREASLEELLAEPIVRTLMRRDGVTDQQVLAAVARRALIAG